MKPILITTPRSGSTVISKYLANIASQHFEYRGFLGEYFSQDRHVDITYFRNERGFIKKYHEWTTDFGIVKERQEFLNHAAFRLNLLSHYPYYLIKVFPNHIDPRYYQSNKVLEFIKNTYDPIYLFRRDKLRQFLSYLTIFTVRKTQFSKTDTSVINHITFDYKFFKIFVELQEMIADLYREFPGKIIYYEDFMKLGANEDSIIKILDLNIVDYTPKEIKTKETPYISSNLENLISNNEEWLLHRDEVISTLNNLPL